MLYSNSKKISWEIRKVPCSQEREATKPSDLSDVLFHMKRHRDQYTITITHDRSYY